MSRSWLTCRSGWVSVVAAVLVGPCTAIEPAMGADRAMRGNAVADRQADLGRRAVAVMRSPGADRACQEIVTRIVAELLADGIPVVALTCARTDAPCLASVGVLRLAALVLVHPRHAGLGVGADADEVVEVRAGPEFVADTRGVLVPAGDRRAGKRLMDGEPRGGAAALAIRAVELVKVMMLEAPGTQREQTDNEPVSVAASWTAAAPTVVDSDRLPSVKDDADAPDRRWVVPMGPHNITMGVGAMMMVGFSRLETAFGPMLTIGRRTSDYVMISAMVTGPAFGRDQTSPAGRASIRHAMGALQADLLGLFWGWLVLRAGIAAGVYHLHVEGQAFTDVLVPGGSFQSNVSGNDGGFAALLSWSAGMVANVTAGVGIFLDGRMFVLTPTPVVLLNGLEIGRAGNPGVALSTGVELRF